MDKFKAGDRVAVSLFGLNPYAAGGYWYSAVVLESQPGKVHVKLDCPLADPHKTDDFTIYSPHRIRRLPSPETPSQSH